ncbi:MAG: TrkH family potassium uptake protein [Candidatus Abyssobacteria bacterium SURF_5]|uniref:TrkH family potassium uptake protein n=1 Tax=Abyssobacteria bacterium (strain SURF_5) TaxID=2093360 RepID=A0A3A4P4U8_ABYX5|nr:MAG: TrkH family potassium uptake protein [Candidatus Abyssubacteria bacterium SURF_5]
MRYRENIRWKYLAIVRHIGTLLLGVALYLLLPLFVLIWYPSESNFLAPFCVAAAGAGACGLLFRLIGRKAGDVTLGLPEGGVIVLVGWILAMVFSAVPFSLSGPLSFLHALFESVSGWTTTGLSVVDVRETPRILLLWRSLMQFAGGAGLVIIMLSAIVGPAGRSLSVAEGRSEQLLPNVRHSAKLVVRIYLGYAAAGILLYLLAGMPLFDAINHSFCSLSTGGFSTRTESIGYYNSVSIELVTMLLMLLGATNFIMHYALLRGDLRSFFRNGEIRLTGAAIALFVPVLLGLALLPLYSAGRGVRVAFFEVISALTTTGYTSVSYSGWPDFGIMCLIVLMLIGGGIYSTAGGLKQYRIYLLFKSIIWEISSNLMPASAVHDRYIWRGENKFYVGPEHIREAGNYLFLYLSTYAAGVIIFLGYGYSLRESLFEFASALGTVGLSIGLTGPAMPPGILWTEIAGMFLGRLEFFVVIYSIIKIFRDAASAQ